MKRLFLILPLALLFGCANLSTGEIAEAEATAIAHCEKLHPDTTCRASCQERDTDENGYVRCSVTSTPAGGEAHDLPSLECAYGKMFSWAKGCQQPNVTTVR